MGFMKTRWTENINKENPLPEYPRPQLERENWLSLNGVYEYAIKPSECNWVNEYDGEIVVPFAVESLLSSVQKPLGPSERLWYKRIFTVPEKMHGKNIILNFGAVDWQCTVYINGKIVGTHTGGYCSFSFDITDYLQNENELVVCVFDPTDKGWQQRGKQVLNTHGFWYTATSGIWQSVWIEAVDLCYIKKLDLIPDIDESSLEIKADISYDSNCKLRVIIFDNGEKIISDMLPLNGKVKFDSVKLWSPEEPFLYDLIIELIKDGEILDTVRSYVGMRKFSAEKDENGLMRFFLNNKPYFQRGLLDQGYWSDGGLTPPADEAMIYDIETMKSLGFNMLRKHIKVELDRWYYHCDRLGMLVWQDMVSGGEYIGDIVAGALPIAHIKIKDNHYKIFKRAEKEWRDDYKRELGEMLNQLMNHTSICCWVPFNEGWGQFDSVEIAEYVKKVDKTRLVDHASGWYDHGAGDFKSIHKYILPVRMPSLDNRIFALTEFGGYSRIVRGNTWDEKKSFGYMMFKDKNALTEAYVKLHKKQIIPLIKKGLSVTVYTQLSDVENEVNGILTFDRERLKIDREAIAEINKELDFVK